MLSRVAGFELKYQVKSPIFWITSVIYFGLAFWLAASDSLQIGWGGYVVRNSPYAIALMCLTMVLFGIFIVTALVPNVVLRDDETGFGPIIWATPVSRFDYLFGRFAGAFGATGLAFLSVPLGALAGAALPGHDPETVGAWRLGAYLFTYVVLCLPTLFVLAAGFFALSTATRSMMATYVVAVVVILAYLLVIVSIRRPELAGTVALLDPFGLSTFGHATRSWTPVERNTLLLPIGGIWLQNRGLWLAIALALLALAWRAFRRQAPGERSRRPADSSPAAADGSPPTGLEPSLPLPSTDARSLGWAPFVALTTFDVRSVLRSPAYVVLLGIAFMNAVVGLWIAGDDPVSPTLPVTRLMIETLAEQFRLLPLLIAAYYAGELVWRDRERRVHEIVDATPSSDWAFVVPKIVAIAIVLFTMAIIIVAAAIVVQLAKGYAQFELGHYLTWYVLPWMVDMVLFAVLAVFFQMLVPHKFGGLLLMVLVLVADVSLARLGFEHNLYRYAGSSPVPLSDMNGQATLARHAAWFRAYWTAGATLLTVLACLLWRRGAVSPLRGRLRRLPSRLRGTPAWIAGAAAVAMIGLGGFIHHNTNVLNEYRTFAESGRWSAEYERTIVPFDSVPQPTITDVELEVDIYPDEPRVVTRGTYLVENKSSSPLREVHVSWPRQLELRLFLGPFVIGDADLRELEVRGASLTREFPDLHYRIYTFAQPLAPGQRTEITFETVRRQRGFRNTNNDLRVVDNGTFLDNFQLAPSLGPSHAPILEDRALRRKLGLPPERRPAPLEDQHARRFQYFRRDSDWVNADLTISSAADQVIVAPGTLIASKVEAGRRVSRFRSDAPILNFFTIQSARYTVRQDRWHDVGLEVYYHPAHAFNVEPMIEAMKESLDYYTEHFSPYQFRQLRIIEFPAYNNFAQAFPGSIAYSEAAGFIFDCSKTDIDCVTYVTAHETGHQWWAHQVIGADAEGQTVLSETLAQYSAIMVMERKFGPEEIRRSLKRSLDGYLRGRGTDRIGEVPLERVGNQAHIRYQKGGLVMYLLKDLLGEEAVNRALRSLIHDFAFKGPPYPTSRELIARLRAEAGPENQQLIGDLFERITLYDFKVAGSQVAKTADGKWSVAIEVEAGKRYADARGAETEAPLDALVDIGVFTAEPGRPGFTTQSVLSLERQRLGNGRQTLTVVVDREPIFVGVDPYNKYIDRNSNDNVARVGRQ